MLAWGDGGQGGERTPVELAAEGGGEARNCVGLAVHRRLDGVFVFNDERDFRVSITLKHSMSHHSTKQLAYRLTF